MELTEFTRDHAQDLWFAKKANEKGFAIFMKYNFEAYFCAEVAFMPVPLYLTAVLCKDFMTVTVIQNLHTNTVVILFRKFVILCIS